VAFLEITYTPDADASAPRHLFLKIQKAESEEAREEPPAEIVFYRSAAREMPDPPLPRCFDAAFARASGRWHLLLEDLSATHAPASGVLSFDECALAVDSLAQIHAHWWEHPRLGTDVGRFLARRRSKASHEKRPRLRALCSGPRCSSLIRAPQDLCAGAKDFSSTVDTPNHSEGFDAHTRRCPRVELSLPA